MVVCYISDISAHGLDICSPVFKFPARGFVVYTLIHTIYEHACVNPDHAFVYDLHITCFYN